MKLFSGLRSSRGTGRRSRGPDSLLRGRPISGSASGALRDQDLRLDDVDAGDLLGHRVLDLDARVDLDEVELARVASTRNSTVPALS
jgi:hypothetical protein